MSPDLSQHLTTGQIACHHEEPLIEADPGADADEPPDGLVLKTADFQRLETLPKPAKHPVSLLTTALRDQDVFSAFQLAAKRNSPSMASNLSLESSAELTCDTGTTTPARPISPSPPHPGMTYVLNQPACHGKAPEPALARPRRISFACADPPKIALVDSVQKERRPTIKFACSSNLQPPRKPAIPERKISLKFACTGRPQQTSASYQKPGSVANHVPGRRASVPENQTGTPAPILVGGSSKYIAPTGNLRLEGSRFHVFASDDPHPENWIMEDLSVPKTRLTMSDIWQKELQIRKLGTDDLDDADDDDSQIDDDEDGQDGEDEDEEDGQDSRDDQDDDTQNADYELDSDDYSDNEEDEVEVDVPSWFPQQASLKIPPGFELNRGVSSLEPSQQVFSAASKRDGSTRRMRIPKGKPDLPDNADFVCGNFDEDRVVEDMYLSVVEARQRSKLLSIPQDIDPSFPESDEEADTTSPVLNNHQETELGFGEMECLPAQQQNRRRRRSDAHSPRVRYRSPAPKKQIAWKSRARSPRPLFVRTPCCRFQSPPPLQFPSSPRASPVHEPDGTTCKPLASRPGLTTTKSLPRPGGMFSGNLKSRRKLAPAAKGRHTRGAIDIVKGLEQKRQRRREKYLQKYCTRARKGQIPEKKPVLPGQGAERMRELVLHMAGKLGPGFVLSI